MYVVCVHDAKNSKRKRVNITILFQLSIKNVQKRCNVHFLTNYNTFRRKFLLKARRVLYFLRLPAKNKQDTKSGLNTCHIIIK